MTQTIATAQCHVPVKHEDFLKIVEPNFGNTIFWSAVPFFLNIPPILSFLKLQSLKGCHDSSFQSHLPGESLMVVTVIHPANTTSLSQGC